MDDPALRESRADGRTASLAFWLFALAVPALCLAFTLRAASTTGMCRTDELTQQVFTLGAGGLEFVVLGWLGLGEPRLARRWVKVLIACAMVLPAMSIGATLAMLQAGCIVLG